jgi:hypothetical protein
MRLLGFFVLGLSACGASVDASTNDKTPASPDDTSLPPPAVTTPGPSSKVEGDPKHALGLNDVTILIPPSVTAFHAADTDDDGRSFLPHELFDRVLDMNAAEPMVAIGTYEVTRLVAVRFDACHQTTPEACTAAHEGRVRLVFQPVDATFGAHDVGLHAFYTVPPGEIAGTVADLRALASIAETPLTNALQPSPAFAGASSAGYANGLGSWLKKHARSERLVQLTVNAQPQFFGQVRWIFAGVEKKNGSFEDIPMLGSADTKEHVILEPLASFEVTPAVTAPQGLGAALSKTAFDSSDAPAREATLALLAAVEDPTKHGTDTVSCVGCHASTVVSHARASTMGMTPKDIPGRFVSSRDLSVTGGDSATNDRTLRALGWVRQRPFISHRVVNESALVLDDIERRFAP